MLVKVIDNVPEIYSLQQLKKDNPNIAFSANIPENILNEYNVYSVIIEDDPAYDSSTQVLEEPELPILENDIWVLRKTVRDKSAQELEYDAISMKETYIFAVQDYMDSVARQKGYDSIMSACSYAGAPNIFQREGEIALAFRANCWNICYQILDDVTNNIRTKPSIEELLSELPIIDWNI